MHHRRTVTLAEQGTKVTTSFTVEEEFLDRVRELAAKREISVTKLLIESLEAELVADEVASGHMNGRPATGYWSSPTVVPRDYNPAWPLPNHERAHRLAEIRRSFGDYSTVVGHQLLFGLPAECLPVAMRAFDAALARALAERELRIRAIYEQEERNGTEPD